MQAIEKAITRARRRLLLSAWMQWLGQFMLAAVAAGLLLLLTERLLALPVPMWVYAALAGLAAVAALITAVIHQPSRQHVAAMVDERLQLKDRLGTALYAQDLAESNPFAKQVVEDAQEAASTVRVNRAFALQPGRAWNAVLPGLVALALMAWLLPTMDLFGFDEQREQEQIRQAQADAAVEQIALAETVISDAANSQTRVSRADPTQRATELASITTRDLSTPGMREKAAAQLSDVQERLSLAKQSLELEAKMLANAMSGIEPEQRGPADDFADALRRGDYKTAQQQLQKLAEKFEAGGMSAEEKAQVQQQLQSMAQQLQNMAQQAQLAQQQTQQQIQQQLQNTGISQQQIQQLQNQGMNQQQVQQAIQQHLQQQGMSQQQAQQQAQQIAQQISQMQQQSQGQGQCSNTGNSLSQSLQQMAQGMQQQQGQGQQQGQQGQQGQQAGQQGQQGGQQGQQTGQSGGQSGQQGMQQGLSSAQQMLNQMAQMQNQMQQMNQAQNQLQNAMQNMNQPGGAAPKAGTAEGGNPFGAEQQANAYNVETRQDVHEGKGRVIASWSESGEMAAGEATVQFNTAVTEAKSEAERAVTDDRVPRRYHGAIKNYFNQLPESPEDVRTSPPPAPR